MLKTWRNDFELEGGGRPVIYLTDLWLATIWSMKGCFFCESVSTFLQLVVAYSSRIIVVATAATKGLTMSTGLSEDWNRVSILYSNRFLTSQYKVEQKTSKHTNVLED